MAIEWNNRTKTQDVVVEHLHSPVVETISFISSLLNSEKDKELGTKYNQLQKELDSRSIEFLRYLELHTDWSFTFLYNFFIPFPYFHEVELFLQEISTLSDFDFLYHFFGESIPKKLLVELIENPQKTMVTEDSIWWESDDQKAKMEEIVTTLPNFRESLYSLLINVHQSNTFQDELTKISKLAQHSIEKVKAMEMEPLALAQYLMGKTFRRTSVYEMYYFIPSYFYSTYRTRIFDSKICIVIYGVNAPLVDFREKSAELELQLKALSDRNRILILRMLARRKEYGAKIAEYLGITTATVSHHLELLKKAGFVKEEKVGTIKYFSYNQEHAETTLKQLHDFINLE
ncbi:ArsR/SmtB family transcription factor [Bacillus salitolerans]|uniref:ArsR/SmtB family transcription factor n=1 Tax=Bacillus salitolerans TaxID=1437434 RepID=A0ABW4LPQ4_9BACI